MKFKKKNMMIKNIPNRLGVVKTFFVHDQGSYLLGNDRREWEKRA